MPRLERADVACWLIKTARLPAELAARQEAVLGRCLRRSYRLEVRMPAGSNPSWLSARQFAAVLARRPAEPAGAPGTMGPCEATGSGGERSAGC